jgi:RecA-family ATPase
MTPTRHPETGSAMNELPPAVRHLLHAGQRQAAIDLLSEYLAADQQEAERRIDRYLESDPPRFLRGAGAIRASRMNALIWLMLIITMALVALVAAA